MRRREDRRTLKESVGTAVNASDLAGDPRHETAVDRVAALGLADPLGAALWRIKAGGDHSALPRAAALLLRRARSLYKWAGQMEHLLLHEICKYLLNAWVQDRCPRCRGRGRIGLSRGQARRRREQCGTCHGDGYLERPGKYTREVLEKGETTLMLTRMNKAGQKTMKPLTIKMNPANVEIPTVPCSSCAGRGWVFVDEAKKASLGKMCPACHGRKKRRVNGAERARLIGCSTQGYWQHWHKRFEDVEAVLKQADSDATWDVLVAFGKRKKLA